LPVYAFLTSRQEASIQVILCNDQKATMYASVIEEKQKTYVCLFLFFEILLIFAIKIKLS